jgi:hypothetical protein
MKKPTPLFYDSTLEKEQISYNQNLSNICILSKTKRPSDNLNLPLITIQNLKKLCFKNKLFGLLNYG